MKRIIVLLTGIMAILTLQGCASSATIPGMTYQGAAGNPRLSGKVAVAPVVGGKQTNPLWTSQVSSAGFEGALKESLLKAGMLNTSDNAVFTLNASLVSLSQPLFGLDLTVTSTVNYVLKDAAGKQVFQQTIVAPYTATVSDSFAAVKRLRLANEGAIRKNIELLLVKLDALNAESISLR